MRRIKIPLQDFALKMQGGFMHEGGRICRAPQYIHVPYYSPIRCSMNDLSGDTYVAVPCRNRRILRHVFRSHHCVQSAVLLNFR